MPSLRDSGVVARGDAGIGIIDQIKFILLLRYNQLLDSTGENVQYTERILHSKKLNWTTRLPE